MIKNTQCAISTTRYITAARKSTLNFTIMPPNMRSIFAKVHQTSKSVGSRRNFSSPAGDGKEPKRSAMETFVIRSLVAVGLGSVTGIYIEYFYQGEDGESFKKSEKLSGKSME